MQEIKKPKILLYDVENSPNLGTYFQLYKEGNIVWKTKDWYMLSFSHKWLGEKKVHVHSLPDYPLYKKDPENDRDLMQDLWKLFDEADVVIGHNSNSFDNKKSNARFIYHGFNPPSPYKQVDTKLIAKRYFSFDSNKLNDLGKYLGLGEKLETGGYELWRRCMFGDKKAWNVMCEYNKQDVILLEKVYLKLRSWDANHPNTGIIIGERSVCPNCGSLDLQSRGVKYGKRSWWCKKCFSWHKSSLRVNSQIT